jgi:hypothetical protein
MTRMWWAPWVTAITPPQEHRKRPPTTFCNARPSWKVLRHADLDRAVWNAYGWNDPDLAAVAEDTILARLLALKRERAGPTGM